jgi:RNA polymerase sigma factor (sigma-70 family)
MDADERLQVEAAQKDPEKIGELYERHFERIYAFVTRRVRDRAAAEDVTAEVFHKALAALPRFQLAGAPFAAWLLRIATNALADRLKRVTREVPVADGDPVPSVESDADASDQRADLFPFVNELPADQETQRDAVYANRRRIRGDRGKRLLRKRGELLERPSARLYETGGLRRVYVRGHENVLKRLLVHAGAFNLGLLMRTLFGIGTPRRRQGRVVAFRGVFSVLWSFLYDAIAPIETKISHRTAVWPLMTASTARD